MLKKMALLTAVDVTVGGVNLDAGQTVTFVYSAMRWCSQQ